MKSKEITGSKNAGFLESEHHSHSPLLLGNSFPNELLLEMLRINSMPFIWPTKFVYFLHISEQH